MRINESRGAKSPRHSIFIGSPTYNGDFSCHFVSSLLQTCDLLKKNGVPYEVYFSVNDSLVARARNDLTDKFLKSECTHCLMIDSDQGWEPNAVMEMLKVDKEFLTGAVPGRHVEETYALKIFTNSDRTPKVENGLIACDTNGVAFALIKREVFEKVKSKNPYNHEVYPFFQHKYFIKKWTDIGRLWIYPNITFTHGPITANYHKFLMAQPKPKE